MIRPQSTQWFRTWFRVAVVLVLLLCGEALDAQNWNANLEGIVLDSSGSPVSEAFVRLNNAPTGFIRQGTTDAEGRYSFPLLPVGTYNVEVGKPGFATVEFPHITLQVGQTARVNITLKVSRLHTSVHIDAQPSLVETASPALGDEIDNRRVSLLPLNGRQFSQLALLAAGATPPYRNGATQQFNTAAQGIGFSVNGQRSERSNFSLDGVSIMEPFAYSILVNPSIDAIREFQVLETSYSAEQGVTSGAQVNIASRAGTNQFSGTAYEYLRNSALDAKNFFDDPTRGIPPFHQNQFGASLGGPLRRDRTFFFGNYEGFRVHQSLTNTTLLPPDALRRGDFSGVDPLTGKPFPAIINPANGQAFSGNQIPAGRIDPVSAAILTRLPLPNIPGAAPGANNNVNVGLKNVSTDQFMLRLDHKWTERQQLFARALAFNSRQLFPFVSNTFAQNPSAPPGFGTNKNDTGRNFALGLTSVLNPGLVNDFRFSYAHYLGGKEAQNINSGFLDSLGISRAPGATNHGIPAINVPGYADMGDSDIFQPQIRKDNTFQFTDNLALVRGRHTIKVGGDFRILRLFYRVEDFGQGVFSFSDGFGSVSGTAFSDFLLGRPFLSFAQAGNSGGNDCLNYFGAYASDEFRATPRLTLTYGLREEFYTSPTNEEGRASILDPTDANRYIVLNNHGQAQNLLDDPLVQNLKQNFGLQFTTSEQAGLPASLIRPDYAGWAPRLGFAYDLSGSGKDSLRGGIGVFNSLGELDYTAETRLSAPITEFLFGLDLCRFYGPGACGQPYAPPQLSYALAYQLGNAPPDSISSPPNIRNGYVYEWSLSLDHQISPSTVLSISYSGSDGHKLPRRALQNQGVPNQPGIRLGYHPQPGSNQFVRATDVNSNYNAMIVRLERRFSRGLSFVAGYTYGKSIDTASGLQGTNQPQDNYNLKAERGLSDFDIGQRFVLSNNWEIPFGKDRHWVRSGPAATVFGGWELSGIVTLQSGQPLTAILSTALSGTQSNGTDRPDLIANPNRPASRRNPGQWFNTAAFQPPPVYFDAEGPFSTPGNEGRNVITGPGLVGTDLSLERHARLGILGERSNLVLRGDFFNLANHPNFDRPGLILGTSNFGRISSAENSRQIQISLRVNW